MKVFRNVALSLIVFFVCLIFFLFSMYKYMLRPISRNSEEVNVEIKLGTSTNNIIKILKEKDLIKSITATKLYVRLNGITSLKASNYVLNRNMNVEKIISILEKGNKYNAEEIRITFPEGKTMRGIAKIISLNTVNTEEDVLNVLKDNSYIESLTKDYSFLSETIKNKSIYYPLEGYLFPDTYYFKNKNVTVKEILEKMLDQTEKVLNENEHLLKKSKYSIHEIITIASITQSEGLNTEDMKKVASVFLNRLDKKMALGSCVTTYYAARVDMGDRNLYLTEINMENPYNTRGPKMEGKLPIGPISNPGIVAIKAVIEPIETDYLFFVSDKDRKLYFTKTYAEHNNKIKELKNKGLWYEW